MGRGLYQLPEADYSLTHSLAEVAKAVPKGVICLISALQFPPDRGAARRPPPFQQVRCAAGC